MMFSHIVVGARDLDKSRAFYDAALGTLGIAPAQSGGPDRFFYATDSGLFAVTLPINGEPATPANGGTIAFNAMSPVDVNAWHAAGIAAGGTGCEAAPGFRAAGPAGRMYLAYLRDPAGNKLCAAYREPA